MRWLITGASGLLGGYLVRHLQTTGEPFVAWSGSQQREVLGVPLTRVDVSDSSAIAAALKVAQPDVILHAAAVARVDECRREPEKARRVNVDGGRYLAETGIRLVLVSTDLVFDGVRGNYRESDLPQPLTVYGQTKVDAEKAVLEFPKTTVARMSLLHGPCLTGRTSFFDRMAEGLRLGRPVPLFADEWRTPLDLPTAASAIVALARSQVAGLVHIGGPERLSRVEMGQHLAEVLGVTGDSIVVTGRNAVPGDEPRPADTSLDSTRWRTLFPDLPWPTYRDSLRQMLARA